MGYFRLYNHVFIFLVLGIIIFNQACAKKSEYPKKMLVGESRKILPASTELVKKDSDWKHLRLRFHTGSDYLNFTKDKCSIQIFFKMELQNSANQTLEPKVFACEEFKSLFSSCKYRLPRTANVDPEKDFLFCDRSILPANIERIKVQYNDKPEKEITSLSGEIYEEESQILTYDLLLSYPP